MSAYERGEERLPETPDLRGTMCDRPGCGKTIAFVYSRQGMGTFCSWQCAERTAVDPWLAWSETR